MSRAELVEAHRLDIRRRVAARKAREAAADEAAATARLAALPASPFRTSRADRLAKAAAGL